MLISALVPGSSLNCKSDEEECKNVMFRVEELLSLTLREFDVFFPTTLSVTASRPLESQL